MNRPSVSFGPFVLERRLGRGGFAEVWKVHHRERGTPAAVKVLLGKTSEEPETLRAFAREVQAAARLDHPGIAWVLDYGRVGESTAHGYASLTPNTPYLAMEYASEGTLAKLGTCTWPEVRAILTGLLDALAHAHAKGVIHRDLKPDNVLLCGPRDLRPGLKLSDFGIAFALDDAATREVVHGTPHYMAPEQLSGEERDQGPWTDLYALGCLAWWLTTGAPPFAGRRQLQLILAHRGVAPPALVPRTPLPDGFEWWLRVLLAKSPGRRFRCAADASRALLDLGHPPGVRLDSPLRAGLVHPLRATQTTPQQHPIRGGFEIRAGLPLDWRRPVPPRPPLEFNGVGLDLFGLRPPAFVGREPERDALWRALTAVHRDRRAHTVVMKGEPGVGVSRLVEWMTSRAAELGAAVVLSAPDARPEALLEDLLLRHFAAQTLTGQARTERIDIALDRLFDEGDRESRARVHRLLQDDGLEGPSRYATVRLVVEAMSTERPVLLVLDDAHQAIDAIRFARHVQNAAVVRPFPVLVVLAAGRIDDPETPVAQELATLCSQPNVSTVEIAPLPREPFLELVQETVGLEPELARMLVDRTAGNPAFALQIIGDWIERDLLRRGSRGFKLRPGVRPQLPPTLKATWTKRLASVLDDLDPSAGVQLQAAAVLGTAVDLEVWARLCDGEDGVHQELQSVVDRTENARTRRMLVERLRVAGLVSVTSDGFRFTASQFRNAVLDHARAARTLRLLHRVAARQMGPESSRERYGRHLLAAGEREAALAPLLDAVPRVQATVGRMSAWRLLDTVEHTMNRLSLAPSDPRWGRLYLERATLADLLGKTPLAFRWARKAGQEASRYGWNAVAAAANFRLAQHALAKGDDDMAHARLVRVTNQVSPDEHPFLVGEALFLLGGLTERAGNDPEEARRLLQAGRRWMLRDPDPANQLRTFVHLAEAAMRRGQLDVAAILIDRSLHLATERGDLAQQVRCLTYAGDLAARNGRTADAIAKLRQAIDVYERIGDAQLALVRCRVARLHLSAGDTTAALQELDRALANAVEVGRSRLLLAVQSVRLQAFAAADQLADLDEVARSLPALMDRVGFAERDNAIAAEAAMNELARRGETGRAHRLHGLAAAQWRQLGDEAALARLARPQGLVDQSIW